MKPHYFNQEQADSNDIMLQMAIAQGYVPKNCLLNGKIVFDEVRNQRCPCGGCEGPRDKCDGKRQRGRYGSRFDGCKSGESSDSLPNKIKLAADVADDTD